MSLLSKDFSKDFSKDKNIATKFDILDILFKLLNGIDLKNIRLVSKSYRFVSTKILFNHVVITGGNRRDMLRYLNIKSLYVKTFYRKS
jgi:hypothetical protein